MHLDPLFSFRIDPAAKDAARRERERVRAVIVDDRDLKIAAERRGQNRLPVHMQLLEGAQPTL